MTEQEKETIKDVLVEICDQMHEINPGLPTGWLNDMCNIIEKI
jgi:hypothetical protein